MNISYAGSQSVDVWKRTEAGAGSGAMKKENSRVRATLMKTKSWSRSHVHEKKSSGAGAVSFWQRLRSLEIIHTVAGHIDDPE